jgi:hypothetical protein
MLAYRLSGTALDFYNRKVASNEDNWSLQDFFVGMLNYCFPYDFRMQQRDRLARCYQNKKTVTAHIAELDEIWQMVGPPDEQEKVVRLWRSLKREIQSEMYRMKLNPEKSSWKKVVAGAERAEIVVAAQVGRTSNAPDDKSRPPSRSHGLANLEAIVGVEGALSRSRRPKKCVLRPLKSLLVKATGRSPVLQKIRISRIRVMKPNRGSASCHRRSAMNFWLRDYVSIVNNRDILLAIALCGRPSTCNASV